MLLKSSVATVVVLLLSFLIYTDARGKKWLCPPDTKICECTNVNGVPNTADCSNLNLTSVPKFAQNYTRFKFSGNNLRHLTKKTFDNVRHLSIAQLYVNACRIRDVDENIFIGMSLDFVDFADNVFINQTQLANCFRANNLKGITLSGIPLGDNVVQFFNTTVSRTLVFVRIANCNITNITQDLFKHMDNLIELDISRNVLKTLDLVVMSRIKILTARGISMSTLPDFNSQQILIHLDIGSNEIKNISKLYSQGNRLWSLNNLFLDGNLIEEIQSDAFLHLSNITSLSLCNMTQLRDFKGLESKSLKYLNISYNKISSILKYSKTFFQASPKLQYLNMFSTSLRRLTDSALLELLKPLCFSMKNLRLAATDLGGVPSKTLRCFRKLETLDLSSNGISFWKPDAFVNVTIHNRVLFRNNAIRLINETNFRGKIFNSDHPPYLDFTGNPFDCSCKAHWFRNWMKGRYKRLRSSLGDNFLCHYPIAMRGVRFVDYDPNYESCYGIYSAIVVAMGIIGACLILLSFVSFKSWRERKEYNNLGL